jgi:hypothetical protein
MIIFGTRGKTIAGQEFTDLVCDHCGTTLHWTFCILRYFHIFWIPVFPTSTIGGIECQHCHKVLKGRDLPGELAKEIRRQVLSPTRRLLYWSGGMMIGAVAAFAITMGFVEENDTDIFLASPQINDLYVFSSEKFTEDPKYPCVIMKIVNIDPDSVSLQLGSMIYKNISGASEAIREGEVNKEGYFSEMQFKLSKAELVSFKGSGMIDSVKRRE